MSKIYLACDHGGLELKKELAEYLRRENREFEDLGVDEIRSVDYPVYAKEVALKVMGEEGALGVLVCGTGQGMAMAANKFPGIRAAVCSDVYSAGMVRKHNDANVLCMGNRVLGMELAKMILFTFLREKFQGGRHAERLELISMIERGEHEKLQP